MDRAVRDRVRQRARNCCEYCRISQVAAPFAQFHMEHIVARQHGGGDDPQNLALACFQCNVHKGPNLSSIDPDSGHIEPLFHPRRQVWRDHFVLKGTQVVGITPIGRATVNLLRMNTAARQELRGQCPMGH